MRPNEHESQLTPEQEVIVSKVEARLAAGLTMQRLTFRTGLDGEDIDSLLDRLKIRKNHLHSSIAWDEKAIEATAAAIAALAEWLEDNTEQTQNGFAITPTYQSMQAIISLTHKNRLLSAITGSWGIGKSKAAEGYTLTCPKGYQKPGAIHIEFTKTDQKPTAALSKILGALRGERGNAYRNENLHNAIGRSLKPGDCLILGECNFLEDAIDVIRSLWDDFGVPIVMMGNPNFDNAVWGNKSEFSALASRSQRFNFPANTTEDVEAWLAWKGVLAGVKPLDRQKFIKTAITIGTRPGHNGGLRALAQALDLQPIAHPGALLDAAYLEQVINQTKGVLA